MATIYFEYSSYLFIGWKLRKDEDEPPDIDSEEFKEIDNKFKS
ncbi:hypothetical protein J2S13_003220 [Oikeobacillus pervagus]|uniref:YqzL family protein n=1 Tax=Oikeobacillus pervagus TaxID=1325931 RepID=A0AAJ1WLY4_9BACI|nr:hypothetical protein [Oikeobacillus pervagus]